jgi:hypothetical protein
MSVFTANKDSGASPYIEQKDVVLCRSGIQLYHKSEVASLITEDNKPAVEREWYREYRPANVVVKAKDLCRSLPVTKEHPDEFVNEYNWKELAGGTTDKEVEVVALEGDSEGEIGLKSSVTFYDKTLYDYYADNNKEVSLGYTCRKHFVPNPDEVGYDILLDEITEVNHLAITRAGRGGSAVSVIDSIIGGLKPMRTGFFAFLRSKKQAESKDSAFSFGKQVFEAVKNSKATTEQEYALEMKGVFDSMSVLKDCEAKSTLMDIVRDSFDNKDKVLSDEKDFISTLDSMWIDIHSDSLSEIAKAFSKLGAKAPVAEGAVKDSDKEEKEAEGSGKEEKEAEDSGKEAESSEKEEKEAKYFGKEEKEAEDSEKEAKDSGKEDKEAVDGKDSGEKDGCNKDSVPFATKDDILTLRKEIEGIVNQAVRDCLGIKDGSADIKGGTLDSFANSEEAPVRDYSSFLDN